MYIRQVFELLIDLFGVPGRNIEMPRIFGHGSERATGGTEKTREDREGFIRIFGRSRAAVYGIDIIGRSGMPVRGVDLIGRNGGVTCGEDIIGRSRVATCGAGIVGVTVR